VVGIVFLSLTNIEYLSCTNFKVTFKTLYSWFLTLQLDCSVAVYVNGLPNGQLTIGTIATNNQIAQTYRKLTLA
jgi:hypothetical protein